eukprot:COSAG01_NODE_6598_length_3587_cov_3.169725_2_plen_236_part_00
MTCQRAGLGHHKDAPAAAPHRPATHASVHCSPPACVGCARHRCAPSGRARPGARCARARPPETRGCRPRLAPRPAVDQPPGGHSSIRRGLRPHSGAAARTQSNSGAAQRLAGGSGSRRCVLLLLLRRLMMGAAGWLLAACAACCPARRPTVPAGCLLAAARAAIAAALKWLHTAQYGRHTCGHPWQRPSSSPCCCMPTCIAPPHPLTTASLAFPQWCAAASQPVTTTAPLLLLLL